MPQLIISTCDRRRTSRLKFTQTNRAASVWATYNHASKQSCPVVETLSSVLDSTIVRNKLQAVSACCLPAPDCCVSVNKLDGHNKGIGHAQCLTGHSHAQVRARTSRTSKHYSGLCLRDNMCTHHSSALDRTLLSTVKMHTTAQASL